MAINPTGRFSTRLDVVRIEMTMIKKRRAVVRMIFLHETYQIEDHIALLESDVGQHAHFVGDKAKEPPTALLEKMEMFGPPPPCRMRSCTSGSDMTFSHRS
jgi:hypothetical protein